VGAATKNTSAAALWWMRQHCRGRQVTSKRRYSLVVIKICFISNKFFFSFLSLVKFFCVVFILFFKSVDGSDCPTVFPHHMPQQSNILPSMRGVMLVVVCPLLGIGLWWLEERSWTACHCPLKLSRLRDPWSYGTSGPGNRVVLRGVLPYGPSDPRKRIIDIESGHLWLPLTNASGIRFLHGWLVVQKREAVQRKHRPRWKERVGWEKKNGEAWEEKSEKKGERKQKPKKAQTGAKRSKTWRCPAAVCGNLLEGTEDEVFSGGRRNCMVTEVNVLTELNTMRWRCNMYGRSEGKRLKRIALKEVPRYSWNYNGMWVGFLVKGCRSNRCQMVSLSRNWRQGWFLFFIFGKTLVDRFDSCVMAKRQLGEEPLTYRGALMAGSEMEPWETGLPVGVSAMQDLHMSHTLAPNYQAELEDFRRLRAIIKPTDHTSQQKAPADLTSAAPEEWSEVTLRAFKYCDIALPRSKSKMMFPDSQLERFLLDLDLRVHPDVCTDRCPKSAFLKHKFIRSRRLLIHCPRVWMAIQLMLTDTANAPVCPLTLFVFICAWLGSFFLFPSGWAWPSREWIFHYPGVACFHSAVAHMVQSGGGADGNRFVNKQVTSVCAPAAAGAQGSKGSVASGRGLKGNEATSSCSQGKEIGVQGPSFCMHKKCFARSFCLFQVLILSLLISGSCHSSCSFCLLQVLICSLFISGSCRSKRSGWQGFNRSYGLRIINDDIRCDLLCCIICSGFMLSCLLVGFGNNLFCLCEYLCLGGCILLNPDCFAWIYFFLQDYGYEQCNWTLQAVGPLSLLIPDSTLAFNVLLLSLLAFNVLSRSLHSQLYCSILTVLSLICQLHLRSCLTILTVLSLACQLHLRSCLALTLAVLQTRRWIKIIFSLSDCFSLTKSWVLEDVLCACVYIIGAYNVFVGCQLLRLAMLQVLKLSINILSFLSCVGIDVMRRKKMLLPISASEMWQGMVARCVKCKNAENNKKMRENVKNVLYSSSQLLKLLTLHISGLAEALSYFLLGVGIDSVRSKRRLLSKLVCVFWKAEAADMLSLWYAKNVLFRYVWVVNMYDIVNRVVNMYNIVNRVVNRVVYRGDQHGCRDGKGLRPMPAAGTPLRQGAPKICILCEVLLCMMCKCVLVCEFCKCALCIFVLAGCEKLHSGTDKIFGLQSLWSLLSPLTLVIYLSLVLCSALSRPVTDVFCDICPLLFLIPLACGCLRKGGFCCWSVSLKFNVFWTNVFHETKIILIHLLV